MFMCLTFNLYLRLKVQDCWRLRLSVRCSSKASVRLQSLLNLKFKIGIFSYLKSSELHRSPYTGGPEELRRQSSVPSSDSGWFWLEPLLTRTRAHCLWLVSGSWTDGLGHRFLRPGRTKGRSSYHHKCQKQNKKQKTRRTFCWQIKKVRPVCIYVCGCVYISLVFTFEASWATFIRDWNWLRIPGRAVFSNRHSWAWASIILISILTMAGLMS